MANAISLSEGHYDGERFSSAAKALFGNIRQRFFASANRTEPSLTYTPMGQCGLRPGQQRTVPAKKSVPPRPRR